MRKKLLSLVLAVCMILSMLPGTAYAAVGELLTRYEYNLPIWYISIIYAPQGVLFQNGSGSLSDQWTGYFSVEHTQPEMTNSASSSPPCGSTTTGPETAPAPPRRSLRETG